MGVSKVELGDNTLVDLTEDTVSPEVLLKGYTAHNKAGEPIDGTAEIVLQWQNTENGTYKFAQNGDRWVANNRGINSSTATSTWTVTVPEETTAYIGYRTATESADKLSITLNGNTILSATGGNMASETVLTLNLVEGENTLVATYTKDGSVHSYGDMAYVILPPIVEQPGQYKYQSKSVTPTSSQQTVYPDTGYDGLYAVTVGSAYNTSNVSKGSFTSGDVGETKRFELGFKPSFIFLRSSKQKTAAWVDYNEAVRNDVSYVIQPTQSNASNRLVARTIGGTYSFIYAVDSSGWSFIANNSNYANTEIEWVACAW